MTRGWQLVAIVPTLLPASVHPTLAEVRVIDGDTIVMDGRPLHAPTPPSLSPQASATLQEEPSYGSTDFARFASFRPEPYLVSSIVPRAEMAANVKIRAKWLP
jgi:hypothetical protein